MSQEYRPASAFFESRHYPYYIASPDYAQKSSGPRMLHGLCHMLNELGYEAYITSEVCSPWLRTPRLTEEIRAQHKATGRHPIAVYPEVVTGNPLQTTVVARWILNQAGHLGGEKEFHHEELQFYWDEWVLKGERKADRLFFPSVDTRVFNCYGVNPEDREGFCYYGHKYLLFGGKIADRIAAGGISLCQDIQRSPSEIAEILRRSKVLYCYEPSNIITEAYVCGCPTVMVDTDYLRRFDNLERHVFPIIPEAEIDFSQIPHLSTDPDQLRCDVETDGAAMREALDNFLQKTQAAARADAELRKTGQNEAITFNDNAYEDWLKLAQSLEIDLAPQATLTEVSQVETGDSPKQVSGSEYVVLYENVGFETFSDLASSIDNLATLNAPWHLVVVSDLDAPPELVEIDCIHWLVKKDSYQGQLKNLISSLQADWIIEAPPGTHLEQSIFSALFQVDRNKTRAIFADNDYYNTKNQRHAPRLKPGVNPAALMSADLAGPLCLTRETWLTLDKRPGHPAPWLSSLWQVGHQYGWHGIKHLPQILFSLPDSARHAPPGLLAMLENELAESASPAHLQAINPACWSVLWPLPKTPPSVHILVQTDGDIGLLKRCVEAIGAKTNYPTYHLGLLVSHQIDTDRDPDLDDWLETHQAQNPKSGHWQQGEEEAYSSFLNRVLSTVDSEFVLFFADELVVLQADWLNELLRACQPADVVGASPRLIQPQTGHIENSGYVLGLQGWRGSAYFHQARVKTPDDFDWIDASRDVTTLTTTCAVIRNEALKKLGGFDELDAPAPGLNSGFGLMLADFSLRCFKNGQRMIYAPRATLAGQAELSPLKRNSLTSLARQSLADDARFNCFKSRWWPEFAHDPFWNPNLSLIERTPTLQTEFFADWTTTPTASRKPKILAHVIANAQADFRITDALRLLRQQGRVDTCVWTQRFDRAARYHSPSELIRLNPDAHIIQHYNHDGALEALNGWKNSPGSPFTIYALDDVLSDIDPANHFYKNFNSDTRTRLAYALARCDRMVVSTEFLANHFQHFNQDIRIVPNRLEMSKWLHLRPTHRSNGKPRIGWAGGTTHQRDLLLLKEVIEQTRNEADWIFFGMSPPEIAPMLAESYPFIPYEHYPTHLASLELDIAVAPLADTLFNRGKSNLRLLELGILGLPVVCTDIEPYQNSPACRVKNTLEEWVAALRERIHDPEGRKAEGARLRQWVLQHYLLENHLDEWLAAHLPN